MQINGNLDLCGLGELQNAVFQNLSTAPTTNLKGGRFYFDTTLNTLLVYDGSNWVNALSIGGYTFQNGLEQLSGTQNVQINIATGANAGNITFTADSNGLAASAPSASTSTAGLIEIATDAEISTGTAENLAVNPKQLATKVSNLSSPATAGTYTKVTIQADGLVSSGGTLVASDIPDISATYVAVTQIGAINGVAGLGADGKVPSSQLPSYVDDVIELLTLSDTAPLTCATGDKYYNTTSKKIFTATATDTWGTTGVDPETEKIYVALDTDYTYRWSGSTMVNLGNPVGQATESTAGIAEIATQTETNTGTDDQRIITPLKLATFTQGMTKKLSVNNTSLSVSGGLATWSISNTLGTADVTVQIHKVSDGSIVLPNEIVLGLSTITITLLATANVAADTYRAVITG